MAKRPHDLPKTLSQASARRLLEQDGWTCTAGGKHGVKMIKEGERPITLPNHGGEEYGRQLTNAILKQAKLKGQPDEVDATRESTGTDGREEG